MNLSLPHSSQPVVPRDIAAMDQYGLVMTMISYVLEKNATSEGRDLQGLDVDVGAVYAPGVCANAVGNESRKETVEVEEEEDCPSTCVSKERGSSRERGIGRIRTEWHK